VPATIAVIGGRIRVGLTDAELQQLAQAPDAMKLSRRDLPYAIATGRLGATTVAATMICAHLAGIEVFVTGGIGGVHRGAPRASTSRPTCRSWRARRWPWSARAPSPSWTSR
jgi:pseudouridine-5'-phosphate glycosidase